MSGSRYSGCTGAGDAARPQVQGLTWPLRNRLLEAAGDRLIDVRDRALLAVGYDTLLRSAQNLCRWK